MTRRRISATAGAAIGLLAWIAVPVIAASPTPTPTVTPNPRKALADYAAGRKLTRSHDGTTIHITDETLDRFEDGSSSSTAAPAGTPNPSAPLDPKDRWRSRYSAQLEVVAGTERDLAEVEHSIPGLWEAFYACDEPAERETEIRPKLGDAIARRQSLEDRLVLERGRLTEIIVAARAEGAPPGWFRDLRDRGPN